MASPLPVGEQVGRQPAGVLGPTLEKALGPGTVNQLVGPGAALLLEGGDGLPRLGWKPQHPSVWWGIFGVALQVGAGVNLLPPVGYQLLECGDGHVILRRDLLGDFPGILPAPVVGALDEQPPGVAVGRRFVEEPAAVGQLAEEGETEPLGAVQEAAGAAVSGAVVSLRFPAPQGVVGSHCPALVSAVGPVVDDGTGLGGCKGHAAATLVQIPDNCFQRGVGPENVRRSGQRLWGLRFLHVASLSLSLSLHCARPCLVLGLGLLVERADLGISRAVGPEGYRERAGLSARSWDETGEEEADRHGGTRFPGPGQPDVGVLLGTDADAGQSALGCRWGVAPGQTLDGVA